MSPIDSPNFEPFGRGLEVYGQANAVARHERNETRRGVAPTGEAAIVDLRGATDGDPAESLKLYSRKDCAPRAGQGAKRAPDRDGTSPGTNAESQFELGSGAMVVGDRSHVQINARGGSGSGTLIVGDDSHVQINARGGSGSGTLIVGDDSHVQINARGGSGSGTLIVGDDSHVHINSRGSSAGGTIVVGDRSDVHLNPGSNVAGGLIVGDDATLQVQSRKSGAFSIEEGSKLYVGGDFDSRRLAFGVEAPVRSNERVPSARSHAARARGHQLRTEARQPQPEPHAADRSPHEPAEYTDPRLQITLALLEHVAPRHASNEHDDGALEEGSGRARGKASGVLDTAAS